jgi:hypothetical protein
MSYYIMPTLPLSMADGLHKSQNFDGTVRQKSVAGIVAAISTKPYATWDFSFSMDNIQGQETIKTSPVALFFATFAATSGGGLPFLFTDPQDNAVTLAQFGTGDGTTTTFQLSRNINGQVDIIQNLNGTPTIYVNGSPVTPASISSTGVVTFSSAPMSGYTLKWTGSFYFLCRFTEDTIDAVRTFTVNNGVDQWNFSGIKFSSEFVTTSTYGKISASGGS